MRLEHLQKIWTLKRKFNIFLIWFIGMLSGPNTWAQPFGCGYVSYLFQGDPTSVYSMDLASGVYFSVISPLVPGAKLNAVGFDPVSNYIWAVNMDNAQLIRVDSRFNYVAYTVPGVVSSYIGDIDDNGIYHIIASNTMHKINVSSGTPAYIGSIPCTPGNVHDIAFNPFDGQIYTVEKQTNNLKKINPSTGEVTIIGKITAMGTLNSAFGAVYFDPSGDLYISTNTTGHIWRVREVHTLSSGNVDGKIFAYGPSSSNNDGTKCPFSEISNEGCANDDDDDDDTIVDCDDTDCGTNVSCVVGGGGGGGLESNGRLAEKIAYRDFWRAKYNVDKETKTDLPRLERSEKYGQPTTGFFRSDYSIETFIPVDVIPGTQTHKSSPEDLTGLSNAVEVFSVDVFRNDLRVGTVLALKSEEGVYEHTKFICDRVKGAKIRRIFTHTFQDEREFPVAKFVNPDGGQEYSTLFSLYQNENGKFILESHWSTKSYPKDKVYYNFQVWSNSLARLETLADEILRLAEINAPIVAYNISPAPEVYISEIFYENQVIEMEVINPLGAEKVNLDMIQRSTETSNPEPVTFEVKLSGAPVDTVRIETSGIFTLGGDVYFDKSEIADEIYVGGGAWGYFGTKDGYTVSTYEVSKGYNKRLPSEARRVERNVHIKGTLKDEISVYRTLKAATKPVNYTGNNTLAFDVNGSGVLEVVLAKASIDKWEDQLRATFNLDGQCSQVFLDRLDFFQKDGHYTWDDIESISFIQKGDGINAKPYELQISNVAFLNLTNKPECDVYNAQELRVFPNPMQHEFNILFSLEAIQPYELTLSNQLGQILATQSGNSDDTGRITIQKPELLPGIYFYTVNLASGSYSGKIVKR